MKSFFLLLSTVSGCFVTIQAQCQEEISLKRFRLDHTKLDRLWADYKKDHQKEYDDPKEDQIRKHIFSDNYNKQFDSKSFKLRGEPDDIKASLHDFSDMTENEFVNRPGCLTVYRRRDNDDSNDDAYLKGYSYGREYVYDQDEELPDYIDWTEQGVVTRVKRQLRCNACWAFSAMGALESQYAIKTGRLETFSEQQMIDCSDHGGCDRGSTTAEAFEYSIEHGVVSADQYPFMGYNQRCRRRRSHDAIRFTDYYYINELDEYGMESALYHLGPLSVAINANIPAFQHYSQGVITQYCPGSFDSLTHGVVVVGYGTSNDGIKYWKCKNSWSRNWGGLDGYFLLQRGVNKCGIASSAYVPIF